MTRAARGADLARAVIAVMSGAVRCAGFARLVVSVDNAALVAACERLGFKWFRDSTAGVAMCHPVPA